MANPESIAPAPGLWILGSSLALGPGMTRWIMSEIHETIEKAHEGEHAEYFNRRIAL